MPDAVTWNLIAEIAPGVDWLLTTPTTANVFRFEHHNPPRHVLLHIAQTDGSDWLFEPRVISSDRSTQILVMENPGVFTGDRRLSLRYADATTLVNNWTVKIYAATIGTSNDAVQSAIATLETHLAELKQLQQTTATQTSEALHQLSLAVAQLLPTPTPTPTPTPPPGIGAYVVSQSSVASGFPAGTYALLNDGDSQTGTQVTGVNGWIQATFSIPVTVTSIAVCSNTSNLDGRKIQFSTDGSNWTDAVSSINGGNYAHSAVPQTLSPSPITAKYWRAFDQYGFMQLSEFVFS